MMTLWLGGLNGCNGVSNLQFPPKNPTRSSSSCCKCFASAACSSCWSMVIKGTFGLVWNSGKRVGNMSKYCWWFRNPAAYGKYSTIFRVLYIPGGWPWDFWTIMDTRTTCSLNIGKMHHPFLEKVQNRHNWYCINQYTVAQIYQAN